MQGLESALAARQKLDGQMLFQDVFGAVAAELLFSAGRVEEALACAEAAVELAREVGGILSAGLSHRVWAQALARLARWDEAEAHLTTGVQTITLGRESPRGSAHAGCVGPALPRPWRPGIAQGYFESATAQFKASGLTRELELVHTYLAPIRAI